MSDPPPESPVLEAWFRFILRRRWFVLAFVGLLSLGSGLALRRAVVGSSVGKMFFGESERFEAYHDRARAFGNDEFFVLAYEDPAPLSPASLDRLRAITSRLEAIEDVGRVESLLDVRRVELGGRSPVIESYADAAGRDPSAEADLTLRLVRDPHAGGLLIGEDGKSAAILVELTVDPDRAAERIPLTVARAEAILADEGLGAEVVHPVGLPVLIAHVVGLTYDNLLFLFPIVSAFLLATVYGVFRRLTPAAVSLGIAFVAVLWTMAFAVLLDPTVSIMASIVPAVILIVSFSDVIHLWSAYHQELRTGLGREAAILVSSIEVGRACLLTSATTFVGFVCFSLIPTPVFRLLGVVLGFGVAIALLLAATLVPIVLSFLTPPDLAPVERRRDLLDRALAAMARLTRSRPRLVVACFAVLLAASGVGILNMVFETDFEKRLAEDHPYRRDQRWFDERFAGTNAIEVYVDLASAGDLDDPAAVARLAAFADGVGALDGVDRVLSWLDLLETVHAALGGEGRFPDDPGRLAFERGLLAGAAPEDVGRLVDSSGGTVRLIVRLGGDGFRGTHSVGRRIEEVGERTLGPGERLEVTGLTYLLGWWLDSILEGQKNGLLLSFLVIAVMMVIGLGSLRIGLISMIPNVLPLVVMGGYVGACWEQVDSDTLIIAMMAIGIGVDDTIHFLMRYSHEARRASTSVALERTYAFAGRAIVMTTVILVVGFLPFATSDYFTLDIMGTLLPAVLVLALAADLLLVPALVQIGWMDIRRPTAGPIDQEASDANEA